MDNLPQFLQVVHAFVLFSGAFVHAMQPVSRYEVGGCFVRVTHPPILLHVSDNDLAGNA